ncbi:MAG: DUF3987 domain-containing protein, partial [Verrucomicrobiae bacterium]|nr:DUF3987 domain-containing protein [Verrucomicrobiae bacterium]
MNSPTPSLSEAVFPQELFANSPVARMQAEIERVSGVTPSMAAGKLLGALSVAGARGLEVESLGGNVSRPNLYLIMEGESGTGKSTVGKRVFGPLFAVERDARERYEQDTHPDLISRLTFLEGEVRKIQSREPQDEAALKKAIAEKRGIERQMHSPRYLAE